MNKKNLILGGTLVLLVALAYLYQGPLKEWRANVGEPENFLASLDTSGINLIEVLKPGSPISLELVGDRWRIAGTKDFYINSDTQNELFSILENAKSSDIELVSENPEKKGEFKTDDEGGTRVTLRQNDIVIADFIVGLSGNDFISSYISLPDSEKTYSIKTNLNQTFNRSDWYDKTIFSSDKEGIVNIRFQYPQNELTIVKDAEADPDSDSGQWSGAYPNGFPVDDEKMAAKLDIMSNLSAIDIPEQTFENTGLEKSVIIVQATGTGIDNTIMIGSDELDEEGEETGRVFAKRGDSDNIYLITEEQRDSLDVSIRDLR